MKKFLLFAFTLLVSTNALPAQPPSFAGHYYLQGAMETGSELLLKPDGRFQWFISYGAIDQHAEGTWKRQAGKIVLTTDVPAGDAWVGLQASYDWNVDIENAWRRQMNDDADAVVRQRCPFLDAEETKPAEPPPRASPNTLAAAMQAASSESSGLDAESLDRAIHAQEQRLASFVTYAESAAAVAMAAPPNERDTAMRAASQAMAEYWREQIALKDLYWKKPGPIPPYATLKLPAECTATSLPKLRDDDSPSNWHPRQTVAARDAGMVYNRIPVTLVYFDGRREVLETRMGGFAMTAQADGPRAATMIIGDERTAKEGFAPVTIAIPADAKLVLQLKFSPEQVTGPAFKTMELRIDKRDLVPVWPGQRGRGRYVRE